MNVKKFKSKLENIMALSENVKKEVEITIQDSESDKINTHLEIIKCFIDRIQENIIDKYSFLLEADPIEDYDSNEIKSFLTFYEEHGWVW